MIVSHRHRFIFIKTSKTAGTSVEIALSRFCGPDDIIAPIHATDEGLRRKLGGRGPQHCCAPLTSYGLRDVGRLLVRGERKLRFHAHMSAAELRPLIGAETFESYYKFCVERNPFDRIISAYYWRKGANDSNKSVHDYVAQRAHVQKRQGFDLYTIDGRVVVDRVLRFENLEAELSEVAAHVDLPGQLVLPRTKAQHRTDRRPYQEVLTADDRVVIESMFADEMALFGYRF